MEPQPSPTADAAQQFLASKRMNQNRMLSFALGMAGGVILAIVIIALIKGGHRDAAS